MGTTIGDLKGLSQGSIPPFPTKKPDPFRSGELGLLHHPQRPGFKGFPDTGV